MTLRARPVVRRRGRAGWDAGDRRNSLINAGFFLAIGISLIILLGYAAWSWYDDHFGSAAVVNGQVITKDDLRNRLAVETFRLDYLERRVQNLVVEGLMSKADGKSQIDFITQRRGQLADLTLERLVDNSLMSKLAADRAISVNDQEIDEQVVADATTNEQRHTWMIEVEPGVSPVTGEVGETERRTALGKAQQALAQLKGGASWEDVAKTVSETGLAPQAGDLGYLPQQSGYDEAFMDAVFAAAVNEPTSVVDGEDGVFRIGRVTEIAPQEVDPTFQGELALANIPLADYRAAAKGDVVRKKLSDTVVAEMSQAGPQRHVLEIFLPEPNAGSAGPEPGVKVRHILYAPNDDATKAGDLKADDPAWAKAEAEARATVAKLKANPEKFDQTARAESDEPSAKTTGGKQPWYYPSSSVDPAFKNAIFADGLTPGQVLEPVKSQFGWHVIQYMRPGDGEGEWLAELKNQATDDAKFKQLAIDNSEGDEAKDGGDIGWIARGELQDQLDDAIFGTSPGSLSDVITVQGEGSYLLKVLGEETREPTPEQRKVFERNGFQYWYTRQKEDADISYSGSSASTG
jgi:parvulin-like peptidyl-prolyl isomerase